MREHYRNYVVSAFLFYAKNGKSSEEYKRKIYNESISNHKKSGESQGLSNPTEGAIIKAEEALERHGNEIRDMEAVEKTLKILKKRPRGVDTVKVLEKVYFTDGKRIHDKVIKTSSELYINERLAYKWLKLARRIFAIERGLRL